MNYTSSPLHNEKCAEVEVYQKNVITITGAIKMLRRSSKQILDLMWTRIVPSFAYYFYLTYLKRNSLK